MGLRGQRRSTNKEHLLLSPRRLRRGLVVALPFGKTKKLYVATILRVGRKKGDTKPLDVLWHMHGGSVSINFSCHVFARECATGECVCVLG